MSTDEVTVRRSQEERENQKQRLSSQNPKTDANERMQEFGGKKVEMKQSNLWSGWPSKSWLKEKDKGESVEAAVGIETDGRRKKIADKFKALAEKSELFCCMW